MGACESKTDALDEELDQLRKKHSATLRYSILCCETMPVRRNFILPEYKGLSYEDALQLADQLDKAYLEKNPAASSWSRTLHIPKIEIPSQPK